MKTSAIPHFNGYAPTYDRNIIDNGYAVVKNIADWCGERAKNTGKLLDIGIGTGTASQPFAELGWNVTGIDGSSQMLSLANSKGFADRLIEADISSGHLPIKGETFQFFLCAGVFEFITDADRFASEIGRLTDSSHGSHLALVLRDYGLNPHFSIIEIDGLKVDRFALERNNLIAVHYDWPDLRQVFQRYGFTTVIEDRCFSYQSPTQGIDTNCRFVLMQRS